LVAELMTKFGYRARVGPVGKDGGVDVTAERDGVVAPEFVLIQCKRHGPDNKVTIATVKQLYADVEAHRATSGLVVTTSYFTAPAEKFIDSVKYRLAGRDFDKLTEWLAEAHKAIVGGSR